MNFHFLFSHTLEAYDQIERDPRPADAVLHDYFYAHKHLGSHDRKFISETLYGMLREELYIDHLARPAITALGLPPEKFLLMTRLYFYSLHKKSFSEREITGALLTLTNLSEENFAALRGYFESHHALQDAPEEDRFSLRYSFPKWMTDELKKAYSLPEIEQLYISMNRPAPLVLRANTAKLSRDDLQRRLGTEEFTTERGLLSAHALVSDKRRSVAQYQSFRDGLFEVQDEGSQLISILLNPKPTARVLDACAGGGGKTLHLAALMKNRGEVYAYDAHPRRFGNILQRVKKSGVQNIRLLDSEQKWLAFTAANLNKLDAVLIDSPCSGSGTLRRNPDLKRRLTAEMLERLTLQQHDIIRDYAKFVKPLGTLLYATCSVFARENEAIVESFLAEHQEFRLVPVSEAAEKMKVDFDVTPLRTRLAGDVYLKLTPERDGTDGFFAAVMQKMA
ncbi:MAG: RsmB/NOP family class I SAM-dependent RNA methyltransferase [Rhizobacter sp.]|nr:RsmB/NOP family class I SAM-dependent RNA methyltransferase [Chlorobiales bacterium]